MRWLVAERFRTHSEDRTRLGTTCSCPLWHSFLGLMVRFLLSLLMGATLCFLTGCVSLPSVEKGERLKLTEKNLAQLEGRYAWFNRNGNFYLPPTSACSSSVAADSNVAGPDTSKSSPSPSSASLDSSEYQIEIQISDGSVLELRPYCKGESMDQRRYTYTGKLADNGYFRVNREISGGTKWYLLPLGMWVFRVDRVQFGLSKNQGLIISEAGNGAVFLGGVFPIFGTNWRYLGTHPKVEPYN